MSVPSTPPTVVRDRREMRALSRAHRAAGRRIALVPTMGYLHEGHLSLIDAARERADVVVASIYVNPTQFAPHEDLAVYPRDEAGDLAKLASRGCDLVFAPHDLYERGADGAPPHETWVTVEHLALPLCGQSRPIFFRGVATVVTKLFHIVEPDVAVFGRKDFQQLRVIERMVRDLDFGLEIVPMPIVREPDGLAMSSRNVRLAPDERRRALAIPAALEEAERRLAAGESDAASLRKTVAERIATAGGRVDYVELVDAARLTPLDRVDLPAVLAVAAHFGSVRLIDNRELTPPG